MPAAAVIPAPQVYSYTAEVKKLVVGSACPACGAALRSSTARRHISADLCVMLFTGCRTCGQRVYFEQIRVLNTGVSLVYICME